MPEGFRRVVRRGSAAVLLRVGGAFTRVSCGRARSSTAAAPSMDSGRPIRGRDAGARRDAIPADPAAAGHPAGGVVSKVLLLACCHGPRQISPATAPHHLTPFPVRGEELNALRP